MLTKMKMAALTSVTGLQLGGDSRRCEGCPGPKLPMLRLRHRFWTRGCRFLSQGLPPSCWWMSMIQLPGAELEPGGEAVVGRALVLHPSLPGRG